MLLRCLVAGGDAVPGQDIPRRVGQPAEISRKDRARFESQ